MKVLVRQQFWPLAPLVALSFASGCGFDSHPSLGWDKHSELHQTDASASDADVTDAGSGADAEAGQEPMLEAGDASDVADANTSDASASSVSCPTGLYVGQFSCRVSSAPVGAAFEIEFTLDQSSPDNPEATAVGPILFSASGALMFADLAARLDCSTGVFHADISNGTAVLVPIPVLVPFVGSIDGEVDESARVLAGAWRFELPPGAPFGSLGTCEGRWRAPLPR